MSDILFYILPWFRSISGFVTFFQFTQNKMGNKRALSLVLNYQMFFLSDKGRLYF